MLHITDEDRAAFKNLPSGQSREALLDKLQEEALELSVAITQLRNGKGSPHKVVTEAGDLLTALYVLNESDTFLGARIRQYAIFKLGVLRDQYSSV